MQLKTEVTVYMANLNVKAAKYKLKAKIKHNTFAYLFTYLCSFSLSDKTVGCICFGETAHLDKSK